MNSKLVRTIQEHRVGGLPLEKVDVIWINGPGSKKDVIKWPQVSEWANGWILVCFNELEKHVKESTHFCVWDTCI